MTFCSIPLCSLLSHGPCQTNSDTIVSSLFWLPLAACWSWCSSHAVLVCVPCLTDCNSVWLTFLLPSQTPCHSRQGHNPPIAIAIPIQDHTCSSSPSVIACFGKQTFNKLILQRGSFCVFPALSHNCHLPYHCCSSIFYVPWGLTRLLHLTTWREIVST